MFIFNEKSMNDKIIDYMRSNSILYFDSPYFVYYCPHCGNINEGLLSAKVKGSLKCSFCGSSLAYDRDILENEKVIGEDGNLYVLLYDTKDMVIGHRYIFRSLCGQEQVEGVFNGLLAGSNDTHVRVSYGDFIYTIKLDQCQVFSLVPDRLFRNE